MPRRRSTSSTCSALTMPSPVLARSRHRRWPRGLAAEHAVVGQQLLVHVAVADLGAHEGDARARPAPVPGRSWSSACRPPGRAGGRFPASRRPARRAGRRRRRRAPCAVDEQHPVAVAIEGDAEVGAALAHPRGQCFGMGGADAVVDVDAVGLDADGVHARAQFAQHQRRRAGRSRRWRSPPRCACRRGRSPCGTEFLQAST